MSVVLGGRRARAGRRRVSKGDSELDCSLVSGESVPLHAAAGR